MITANNKLDLILRNFNSKYEGIPDFVDLKTDVAQKKREEIKIKLFAEVRNQLVLNLGVEEANLKFLKNEIRRVKYPMLNSANIAERQIGESQVLSGQIAAQARPVDADKMIINAIRDNRLDYAFSLGEAILRDPNSGEALKYKVNNAIEEAEALIGYTEREDEIRALEITIEKYSGYVSLLDENPEGFAKNVKFSIMADEVIKKNDDLEAQRIAEFQAMTRH